MADFDPDKWLAENVPQSKPLTAVAPTSPAVVQVPTGPEPHGFDPDAFLAANQAGAPQPPQDPAAPIQRPAQDSGPQLVPQPSSGIIPSWLLPKSQQAPAVPDVNPNMEQRLQGNVQAGAKENLALQLAKSGTPLGIAINAADHYLFGRDKSTLPDTKPGILGTAVSLADPTLAAGGAVAEAAAKKAFGQGAELVAKSQAPSLMGKVLDTVAGQTMREAAVKGPIEFGAYGGAKEAAKQIADGEFKPKDLASEVLKNAAFGLAAAPVTVGASKLFGALAGQGARSLEKMNALSGKTSAVDGAWDTASDSVAKLVEDGTLKPEDAQLFTAHQAQKNLEVAGIVPSEIPRKADTGLNSLLDNTKFFSDVDKVTGTRSFESVHNMVTGKNVYNNTLSPMREQTLPAVKVLDKSGVDPAQVSVWLQHMEDAPSGDIVFNPSELKIEGKVDRPAYQGPMPTPEQFSALQQLRASYTKPMVENPELAARTGYLPGYINIEPKTSESLAAGSARGIETPSFTLERTEGAWDPTKHESDYRVLLDSFQKKVAKFTAYNEHLPDLQKHLYQLQMLNQPEAAKRLESLAMDTMGLRGQKDLAGAFTDRFVQDNRESLNAIASRFENPDDFVNKVVSVSHNLLYTNSVFTNLRIILSHWVQPETIAAAEIGLGNVERGQVMRFTKSGQALLKELMPLAKTMNNEVLEQALIPKTEGKVSSVYNSLSDIIGKPGKTLLHWGDTNGRSKVMLGSWSQFNRAFAKGGEDGVKRIIDGMLPGEQQLVLKSLAENPEDAAKTYALIRQNRSMFIYNTANKSDVFKTGLGKKVPFTTWSRGIAMNVLNDVQEKNAMSLAKRFVYPALGLGAFTALTGHKLSDNPVAEGFNALHMVPYPMIQEGAETLKHLGNVPTDLGRSWDTRRLQGTAQGLGNLVPGLPALNRGLKRYDKTGSVAEALGFKTEAPVDAALPKLLKSIINR